MVVKYRATVHSSGCWSHTNRQELRGELMLRQCLDVHVRLGCIQCRKSHLWPTQTTHSIYVFGFLLFLG